MELEFQNYGHRSISIGHINSAKKIRPRTTRSCALKQDLQGKSVAVIGLWKSGRAAVKLALGRGASVLAMDQNQNLSLFEAIGIHNYQNAAVAGLPILGLDIGVTAEALNSSIERLRPPPHRICKLFGYSGMLIQKTLLDNGLKISCIGVANMKEAVDHARKMAKYGDAILLSPGYASFDEFRNFEHQGMVSRNWQSHRRWYAFP